MGEGLLTGGLEEDTAPQMPLEEVVQVSPAQNI
jgi:hypothetical protein